MPKRVLCAVAALSLAHPALAEPITYEIDPSHTYPSIEFPHMGISVWRGKFDKTSGTVVIDRAAKTGSVDITVAANSVDFGLAAMDDKAKSDDFFDVAQFPTVTYTGKIQFVGDEPKSIVGEITVHGVTKPLTLDILSSKCIEHPFYKKEVCGADAQGTLNWSEFGMKMSSYGAGDAGKTLLRIQVEGMRKGA
ncbi:MAG TPA: YceI family protein [Pseudomonadales bacterium]|nr:YceI family protein [Pseudomonadales bacterium]